MYQVVLLLHSWLRWVLLALGLVLFVRSMQQWRAAGRLESAPGASVTTRPAKNPLSIAFVAAFDSQVLLGLLLYVIFSPMVPRTAEHLRLAMKSSLLRFFAVEHTTAMVLALLVVHGGSVWARRAANASMRHRRTAVFVGLALFLMIAGIPWPLLPYARPLFRLP